VNVVPKDVNICQNLDCSAMIDAEEYADKTHHHPIAGDPDYHTGALVACDTKYCKRIVEAFMDDQDAEEGEREAMARQLNEISGWWVQTAMNDAEQTLPKAIEYGAVDFDIMGQFMVALVNDKLKGASPDEKARIGREMAVTFYLLGKLGRMVGAYATGVMPSDDTLFDTTIYSMMLRRIRGTGTWVD
jgi:hypothetical protein